MPGLLPARLRSPTSASLRTAWLAYYPFNGNADDASGNGNHGLAVGAALTTDRFGGEARAYQFNGSNSYILIPAYPALNAISNSISISVWIKLTVQPARSSFPIDIIDVGPNGCTLGLMNNPSFPGGSASNDVFFPYSSEVAHDPLSVGRYYHIVATASNRVSSVFVDGSLILRTNGPGIFIPRSYGWNIGAWANEGMTYDGFTGVIDDVRLYSRALSATEVADLYQFESIAPFAPALAIQVKAVRVNMFLQPGENYQLETSSDLTPWTPFGVPFIATASTMFEDFDVLNAVQYFRINEAP